jgi:hypothetical protein
VVARRGTPRRPWSWLDDPIRRAQFEADARRELPDLRYRHRQRRPGPVDIWEATVLVDHDVRRKVTVEFERSFSTWSNVYADGPTDSPHRYAERGRTKLCLWKPGDPPERRWQVENGLLALFGIAAHHLFKELWWRENDEWLGEEAPHDEQLSDTGPTEGDIAAAGAARACANDTRT